MGPEAKIQTAILKYLKGLPDTWCFKVMSANINGVPDLAVCHKGQAIFFEVKSPTGKVSPIQAVQIDRIKAAGGQAHVVRSVDEVKSLLSPTQASASS